MALHQRVTMADVAERSQVSLSTVSLVLRDKPGVGAETRQRVMNVAKELGYIVNNQNVSGASALANIGLVVKVDPGTTVQANPFYSYVVAGIEAACRQRKINLFYATMAVDEDNYPVELPRILLEEGIVEGFILVGALLTGGLLQTVERFSLPIVLVDAYASTDAYDVVLSGNYAGAYQAVTHLIQNGHRHIGLVGSHSRVYPSIQERQEGYVQALADAGIDERYVAEGHFIDVEEIAAVTARLMEVSPHVTAIFAVNDNAAIAVMDTLRNLGRKVPEDVSVIGYDDIDPASFVSPALTTMHVDKAGMGRLGVQLLINRIEHPESSLVKAVIAPRLIARQSVARIGKVSSEA